jgi:actin related protein 2/3 complex, subunit 3
MPARSATWRFFPSKPASVAPHTRQATPRPQVPPAPCRCSDALDIIEECLTLFRANCLFRNFEIKGPADRTLIYGILFISDCLNKLGSRPSQNQQEATKTLNALALENFNIPGEPGFPLNPLYAPPANRNDAGNLLVPGRGLQ